MSFFPHIKVLKIQKRNVSGEVVQADLPSAGGGRTKNNKKKWEEVKKYLKKKKSKWQKAKWVYNSSVGNNPVKTEIHKTQSKDKKKKKIYMYTHQEIIRQHILKDGEADQPVRYMNEFGDSI